MARTLPASGRIRRDAANYHHEMRLAPVRPLPSACYWTLDEGDPDRAHLYWNQGCIGYVSRKGGHLVSVIQWRQRVLEARCGSVAQGMRWIERWVEKREGFPGGGELRWYERLPRREMPPDFYASLK